MTGIFGLKGAAVKAKLARQKPITCVGLWFPYAPMAEMISRENVDVLVLDLEHGPWDTGSVLQVLTATTASPAAVVARPGTLDPAQVQLLLDLGVDGLMVGHCDDLQTTRRAVAMSKYPPLGRRGVGPTRASGYHRALPEYLRAANDATMLWAQVERRVPEAELTQMLQLPGVDALMLGPCDMAGSIGHLTDWGHPDVAKLVEETVAVARQLGKPFGVPGKLCEGQLINLLMSDIGALQAGLQATAKESACYTSPAAEDSDGRVHAGI